MEVTPDSSVRDGDDDFNAERTKVSDLQAIWEKKMKDLSPKKKHRHVEAFLFYWNQVNPSYLQTEQEIKNLEQVLRQSYSFAVHHCPLNPGNQEKAPELWMQRYLLDLICDHDKPDTLVIIYYAGHGNPDEENGAFLLRGGNSHTQNPRQPANEINQADSIAWERVRSILYEAHHADFLLIFDCCFAGSLGVVPSRGPRSRRHFEFLGACGDKEMTAIPGESSFTYILVWALEKLAQEPKGFTTSELWMKMRECPNYKKLQGTPCLVSATDCIEKLLVTPLGILQSETIDDSDNNDVSRQAAPLSCLRLDFLLAKWPVESDIQALCDQQKEVIRNSPGGLIQNIVWTDLRQYVPPIVREVVKAWQGMTRTRQVHARRDEQESSSTEVTNPDQRPTKRRKGSGCIV